MKYSKYLLWLLALLPVLLLRDFTPDNELRYLSITDEAIRNGHLFAFYNHGAIYADKPPLYLWILMLSRTIWGTHCMIWLSLFSVLPAFVILWIMDKWTAGEIKRNFRTSGQLMLLTTAYFLGASVVLRMDMLMSMFIVLALYTFYQMYMHGGKPCYRWLLPVYLFLALFTKGPLGILIPVVSIFTFLVIKKQIRQTGRFLGWSTWIPILVLSGIWIFATYMEGGKEYVDNLLFHQTINRMINSFHHKNAIYFYIQTIGYSMAPWILLFIVVLFRGIKNKQIQTPLEQFFLTTISVTFIMLSLISSKLEIYLLPAYPFIAFLAVGLLSKKPNGRWIRASVVFPACLLLFGLPAIIILSKRFNLYFLQNGYIYGAATFLSLASMVSLILSIKYKKILAGINVLSIGLLGTLFIAGWSLPALNTEIGYGSLALEAKKIARELKITNFYYYKLWNAQDMDIYLNTEINKFQRDSVGLSVTNQKPLILFLYRQDTESDPEIHDMILGKKQQIVGKYSIIVCQ